MSKIKWFNNIISFIIQYFMQPNYKSKICLLIMGAGLFLACKKTAFYPKPLASLRLIHAMMDPRSLKVNNNQRDSVRMYNARVFGVSLGKEDESLQVYAGQDLGKP